MSSKEAVEFGGRSGRAYTPRYDCTYAGPPCLRVARVAVVAPLGCGSAAAAVGFAVRSAADGRTSAEAAADADVVGIVPVPAQLESKIEQTKNSAADRSMSDRPYGSPAAYGIVENT